MAGKKIARHGSLHGCQPGEKFSSQQNSAKTWLSKLYSIVDAIGVIKEARRVNYFCWSNCLL
jgi:hypothetical protein